MEENKKIEEIKAADEQKLNNIKLALEKLEKKESKFLFLVTNTPNPAASIYEVYYHAHVAKKMGYEAIILTDTPEYEKPYWIESELTDLEHISITDINIEVGPTDVLVIPDIFSNVMEQTKNLPCVRVGLLQSIDYMVNALLPSTEWNTFGINEVITTSETLGNIFMNYYGNGKNYIINTYKPTIPDYFIDENNTIKRLVVSIVGRNPNEISKVVKLFYAKYPQYGWITFDSMITESKPPKALTRKQYAERLKTNFASVWVDRISSFGTFPLEAMKARSIPIGLVPDIIPEYLIEKGENDELRFVENSGVWTNDIYKIPELIGETLTKFLDDTIDETMYDKMGEIASNYTQEETEKGLIKIYEDILRRRKEQFEEIVKGEEEAPVEENK